MELKEEPKLKDIEKGYELTARCIKVFNSSGTLKCWDEVKEISHFGVVRDYTIVLKNGWQLWIDAGVIKMIVEHEKEEAHE